MPSAELADDEGVGAFGCLRDTGDRAFADL